MSRPASKAPFDAVEAFEDLRPLADRLRALQRKCRPFGRDYHALAVALQGLDESAEALTGRRHFFGAQQDTVGPVRT